VLALILASAAVLAAGLVTVLSLDLRGWAERATALFVDGGHTQ
jgi:hypothetical protein